MLKLTGSVLFAGDWHGSLGQAEEAVRYAARRDVRTVFQLGDFGIWEGDRRFLDGLDSLLHRFGVRLFFIDGNHENFQLLYQRPLRGDGTRHIRQYITHVSRGTRLDWDGVRVLALGGAPSIDVKFREPGVSWWPEETITVAEAQAAISGGEADLMLCHDSPATAPNPITDDPAGQAMAERYFGAEALQNCRNHRELLAEVTDAVKPRLLLHGHYHRYMDNRFQHSDGTKARAIGLTEGRGPLLRSTTILHPLDVKMAVRSLDNRDK